MEHLLFAGAGGGGSNNLMRAIRRASGTYRFIGTNADPFALARSLADDNYLVSHSREEARYVEAINRVSERCSIDLLIPTNDTELDVLSRHRDKIAAPMYLPEAETVAVCQDKARFGRAMTDAGLPSPRARIVESLGELEAIFDWFGRPETLWIRLRRGTGSKGSLPVSDPEQARFWIRYWQQTRGVEVTDFIVNDFLPGREFAWQSLWRGGEVIIAKTCERLEYLFGENTPSKTMSTPRVARLVDEPAVTHAAVRAVRSLAPSATGVFSLDIKQDAAGRPHVTEVNAGRFFRISPIFNCSGRLNMAELFLSCASGQTPQVPADLQFADFEEETFWICDIDDAPSVITRQELESRFHRLVDG